MAPGLLSSVRTHTHTHKPSVSQNKIYAKTSSFVHCSIEFFSDAMSIAADRERSERRINLLSKPLIQKEKL